MTPLSPKLRRTPTRHIHYFCPPNPPHHLFLIFSGWEEPGRNREWILFKFVHVSHISTYNLYLICLCLSLHCSFTSKELRCSIVSKIQNHFSFKSLTIAVSIKLSTSSASCRNGELLSFSLAGVMVSRGSHLQNQKRSTANESHVFTLGTVTKLQPVMNLSAFKSVLHVYSHLEGLLNVFVPVGKGQETLFACRDIVLEADYSTQY